MSRVAFIGGGSFGTALAVQLGHKGEKVNIFDRDINVCNDINNNRRNSKYIKDVVIPENITAYNDLDSTIEGADYLVLAVPSHVIRDVAKSLKGKIKKDVIIISIAKGIEATTNKRLSQVIEEELPNPVVILSGPSHAEEVAIEIPTTLVADRKSVV